MLHVVERRVKRVLLLRCRSRRMRGQAEPAAAGMAEGGAAAVVAVAKVVTAMDMVEAVAVVV